MRRKPTNDKMSNVIKADFGHEDELMSALLDENKTLTDDCNHLIHDLGRAQRDLRYTRFQRTVCIVGMAGMAVGALLQNGWPL